ncbi:amidohydrolase family protein [Cysteiniphilum halobium]|uniref:amidohydrolase family protein n=1 Tax=Cysteiniphilum halobium TaxID=2219059 RepID=UPI003F87A947
MLQKIYDTHVHIWNKNKLEMPWLNNPEVKLFNRNYDLMDYQQATARYNVTQINYVEVDVAKNDLMNEAQNIIHLAKQSNTITSIILGADLTSEHFPSYILSFIEENKVIGVRHGGHDFQDASIYLSKTFITNVKLLGELGLYCEVLPKIQHMNAVYKLMCSCANTRFIIDHCGGINPLETNKILKAAWHQGIKNYAMHPQAICKISGLLQNIGTPQWQTQDLTPIIEYCYNLFGEERVIFGSNWPMCNLYGCFDLWITALNQIIKPYGNAFAEKLFHQNAKKLLSK